MKKMIWTIGGGKGGTGKTVISALLAANSALEGKRVIIVDGDFGGGNLHTLLNISSGKSSLNDFFEKKIRLEETMIETGISDLKLISGDMKSLNPLSVRYIQRLKLYRHIKELDADLIIIDLGAGTALNTIDMFLLADRLVVVTTPEITSIENLYIFIKKIIIRKIKDSLNYEGLSINNNTIIKEKIANDEIKTFSDFLNNLIDLGDKQNNIVTDVLGKLNINIILNQVTDKKYINYGVSLKSILKRHFRINAMYSGKLFYDQEIIKFINGDISIENILQNKKISDEVKEISGNIFDKNDIPFIRI